MKLSQFLAAVIPVFGGLASGTPVQAAPDNDAFGSRRVLAPGLPSTDTGNNIGATQEPGEPIFLDTGIASVWWSWTPAASGWVRITTETSDFNTVLGVFEGAAVASLTPVAANDDSTSPYGVFSSLVYRATSGTPYAIGVFGAGWETGNVSLAVEQVAAPTLPTLTHCAISPGDVDVELAPGNLTVDLGVYAASSFSFGYLTVYDGHLNYVSSHFFNAAALQTGNLVDGRYQIPITVEPYSEPGQYRIAVTVYDQLFQSVTRFPPLPGPSLGWFGVANAGPVDYDPPVLVGLAYAPGSIDVGAGAQSVQIDLQVTDDVSGFDHGSVYLADPLGTFSAYIPLAGAHRIAGTAGNGTYRVFGSVPHGAPPGAYETQVSLTDANGHGSYYSAPATPTLAVTNSGTVDTLPPALTAFHYTPDPVNVGVASVNVTATANITDALAGFQFGTLTLYDPMGSQVDQVQITSADSIGGSTYQVVLTIPGSPAPGLYTSELYLYDQLANTAYFDTDDATNPFPPGTDSALEVQVAGGGLPPYDQWLLGYPGLGGPTAARTADPDRDGICNLLELLLGLHPLVVSSPGGADPNRGNYPLLSVALGNATLTFRVEPAAISTGTGSPIEFGAETDTDLFPAWTPVTATPLGGGWYSATLPMGSEDRRFLRLWARDPNDILLN